MTTFFIPRITLPPFKKPPETLSSDFIWSMLQFFLSSAFPKYPVPIANGSKNNKYHFIIIDKETLTAMENLTHVNEGTTEKVFIPVSAYEGHHAENEVGSIYECRFILSEVDQTYSRHKYKYLVAAPDYQTLLKAQKDPNTESCLHFLTELPKQDD